MSHPPSGVAARPVVWIGEACASALEVPYDVPIGAKPAAQPLRHVVPGAGRITPMAKATAERYGGEYSLVYMDIDERLHRIPAVYSDPREIEWRMHRDYDPRSDAPTSSC